MSNDMKNEEAMQPTSQTTSGTSRRGLLRLGGFTLATAIIAACSDTDGNKIGTSGTGETTPQLPDAIVDNGVLLRTMAGLETSIANAYQRMIDESLLSGPSGTFPSLGDTTALITTFQAHHVAAAKGFNQLAVAAGAEAWTCGNTRYDDAFITPIFDRALNGAEATDTALAIAPSEDPVRDFANLVHARDAVGRVLPGTRHPGQRAGYPRRSDGIRRALRPPGRVDVAEAQPRRLCVGRRLHQRPTDRHHRGRGCHHTGHRGARRLRPA